MEGRLLLINGSPGTGKSTLAAELSRRLRLPLLAKDTVKEALAGAPWTGDRESSNRLGGATFPVLYAIARVQVELGLAAVLEAPFHWRWAGPELGTLVARSAMILCEADATTSLARYGGRAGARHPVHLDAERLAEDSVPAVVEPPPGTLPLLRVRTDDGYDPGLDRVLDWCRTQLDLPTTP
jgi:predicted kinase